MDYYYTYFDHLFYNYLGACIQDVIKAYKLTDNPNMALHKVSSYTIEEELWMKSKGLDINNYLNTSLLMPNSKIYYISDDIDSDKFVDKINILRYAYTNPEGKKTPMFCLYFNSKTTFLELAIAMIIEYANIYIYKEYGLSVNDMLVSDDLDIVELDITSIVNRTNFYIGIIRAVDNITELFYDDFDLLFDLMDNYTYFYCGNNMIPTHDVLQLIYNYAITTNSDTDDYKELILKLKDMKNESF